MREVKAYQCGYCRRQPTIGKRATEDHEARCSLNPEVRACRTCKHAEVERPSAKDIRETGARVERWCHIDMLDNGAGEVTSAGLLQRRGCPKWESKGDR